MIVSNELLAYLAGIIDGEGWIGVYGAQNAPGIAVQMAHPTPIFMLHESFGGSVCTRKRSNPNHSDIYRWCLHSKRELPAILRLLAPYLTVKKRQVELIMSMLDGAIAPYDAKSRSKELNSREVRNHA